MIETRDNTFNPRESVSPAADPTSASPPLYRWTLSFLLVGLAWGFTTPFIRRAAVHFHPPNHASLDRISPSTSWSAWCKYHILKACWTVVDLLRSPAYALPLLLNVTGSVWFFLLIGQAGECYAVPLYDEFLVHTAIGRCMSSSQSRSCFQRIP